MYFKALYIEYIFFIKLIYLGASLWWALERPYIKNEILFSFFPHNESFTENYNIHV